MLRIRLKRVGKKGRPSYRVVVADSRAPRDGAYVEWIGTYDPLVDPPKVTLDQEKAGERQHSGPRPGACPKDCQDGVCQRQGPGAVLEQSHGLVHRGREGGVGTEEPAGDDRPQLALGAVFARYLGRLENLWLAAGGEAPNWADLRRFGGDLLLRDAPHTLWQGRLRNHVLGGGISLAIQRLTARRPGWVVDVEGGWVWQTTVEDGLARLVPYPLHHP